MIIGGSTVQDDDRLPDQRHHRRTAWLVVSVNSSMFAGPSPANATRPTHDLGVRTSVTRDTA